MEIKINKPVAGRHGYDHDNNQNHNYQAVIVNRKGTGTTDLHSGFVDGGILKAVVHA